MSVERKWQVRKRHGMWQVIPPEGGPVRSYWDHCDAIRRAQQLAKGRA